MLTEVHKYITQSTTKMKINKKLIAKEFKN